MRLPGGPTMESTNGIHFFPAGIRDLFLRLLNGLLPVFLIATVMLGEQRLVRARVVAQKRR